MTSEAVTARIDIDVASKGVDQAVSGLNRLAGANDQLVVALDRSSKIRERNEAAVERLAKAYDREYKLARDLDKAQRDLAKARDAGLAGTIAYEKALAGVASRQADFTRHMNDNAKGIGLARHELINLSRQLQDVTVSLAGGQSPFTVLLQQGSQVADVLATSKAGVGGALRELTSIAARAVGRAGPLAAVAGVFYEGVTAAERYQRQLDVLTISLNGLGRSSGLTARQAAAIADANAGSLSNAAARGVAGQMLGAGVSGASLGASIGLTNQFSRRFGVDLDAASRELSSALADPARGAEELAKKYALVSLEEERHIKQLAAVGDKSGATAALLATLGKAVSELDDPTWRLSDVFGRVKKAISDLDTSIGAYAERLYKGDAQIAREEADRARGAAEKAARLEADRIARRNDELQALRDDSTFAVREAQARTFAEREALATQRAYAQTLRETNDAGKAAIAAERARALLIAEAARKVDDFARQSADTRAGYGRTPYERGRLAIQNQGRDLLEQLPNGASPMAREFNTAATAANNLANALNAAAGKVGGLPAPLAPPAAASARLGGKGLYQAIIDAEGTGKYGDPYNASLGYLKSDKPLTSMTMAESLAWGEHIRKQTDIGRRFNSSAKGAFQIVNSTQRLAMQALGLGANDPFSVDNQQRMADWIAKAQGLGAWEGFKAHPEAKRGIGVVSISRAPENDNGVDQRARVQGIVNKNLAAYDRDARAAPLREANRAIEEQNRLVETQGRVFGASAAEMARANEVLRLRNDYARQNIPIDADLARQIEETGRKAGEAAEGFDKMQRAERRAIENQDQLRSGFNDGLGSFITDLRQGKSAADALASSLEGIGSKLQNIVINRLTDSLFGETGKSGGGFLSGVIGKIFGFADGGVMTSSGPLPLRRYADGGVATSPQLALFGEGSGAEAYVPLKNGGIPVNLKMPAPSGGAPVTVNLIGAPPDAKVSETRDSRGGRRIDVVLNESVAGALSSPQGVEALGGGFGVRPNIARR